MDTLGRDCYVEENGLYLYKGAVFIKPLAMIDDIATAAECGANSLEINAKVNSKMYSKKLRLSEDKRKLLHVSKRSKKCDGALNAHGKEIEICTEGENLGDVLSSDGTNTKNKNKNIERTLKKEAKGFRYYQSDYGNPKHSEPGIHFYPIAFIGA